MVIFSIKNKLLYMSDWFEIITDQSKLIIYVSCHWKPFWLVESMPQCVNIEMHLIWFKKYSYYIQYTLYYICVDMFWSRVLHNLHFNLRCGVIFVSRANNLYFKIYISFITLKYYVKTLKSLNYTFFSIHFIVIKYVIIYC